MKTIRELIDEAIAAGKVQRIPEGLRAIPLDRPSKKFVTYKQRPEACGKGRTVPKKRSLDELG